MFLEVVDAKKSYGEGESKVKVLKLHKMMDLKNVPKFACIL